MNILILLFPLTFILWFDKINLNYIATCSIPLRRLGVNNGKINLIKINL
jgi:hypothetical protein